jgi:hypothetical protein
MTTSIWALVMALRVRTRSRATKKTRSWKEMAMSLGAMRRLQVLHVEDLLGRRRERGRGKVAVHEMPSLHTPSAILRLGMDILVTYNPLGDSLGEDELLELDWFAPAHPTAPPAKPSKKGKTKSMAPISGVSPPASPTLPTRRWRSFVVPQMTLNPKLEALGEVELSDGAFHFPFKAQVNTLTC